MKTCMKHRAVAERGKTRVTKAEQLLGFDWLRRGVSFLNQSPHSVVRLAKCTSVCFMLIVFLFCNSVVKYIFVPREFFLFQLKRKSISL